MIKYFLMFCCIMFSVEDNEFMLVNPTCSNEIVFTEVKPSCITYINGDLKTNHCWNETITWTWIPYANYNYVTAEYCYSQLDYLNYHKTLRK